jgi:hypothetical protein
MFHMYYMHVVLYGLHWNLDLVKFDLLKLIFFFQFVKILSIYIKAKRADFVPLCACC